MAGWTLMSCLAQPEHLVWAALYVHSGNFGLRIKLSAMLDSCAAGGISNAALPGCQSP